MKKELKFDSRLMKNEKECPKVTVSILSYKRPEGVKKTLESVLMQDYPNLEIIVVDNGSDSGIPELIQCDYPMVKVIALSENLGSCVGRNNGIGEAAGEIVVTLDDDIYFDSRNDVQKIMDIFNNRPEIGCIAFMVLHTAIGKLSMKEWCHPRDAFKYAEDQFDTDYITEGACAFRKKPFLEAGGYYPRLFIAGEGPDLAVRIWNKGYKILYTPDIRVWHTESLEGRASWRSFYYLTRNYIWIALRNYRYIYCLKFLSRNLTMMFIHSVRNGQLISFSKGIVDGIKGAREVLRDREVISSKTESRLREVRALRPGLIYRIRKHWYKTEM